MTRSFPHSTADREALRVYPTIERWLRPYKELTHWQYLGTMLYFLDFAGPAIGVKDPDSFLAWAKKAEGIEVQDMLEKFAETKTRGQKLQAVSEIRSFLKRNGKVDLPVPGMTKLAPARHHRSYKREEILTLMGYLDQKTQKLYVLFAKDSGLRPVHILQVLYRHLKDDLEAGNEFVHVNLDPPFYEGRKVAGLTFIGPETVKLLRECIAEKLVSKEPESTIFPMTYKGITSALQLARKKAKLDPVIQPSFGCRKYFENALDRANLDFDKKRLIEGHSTGVRNRHYTDRDIDELRGLYQQSYQFLELSEKAAATREISRSVQDLERRLVQQDQHIKALEAALASSENDLFLVNTDSIPKVADAFIQLGKDIALLKKEVEELKRKGKKK